MMFDVIVAVSQSFGIGFKGRIPWNCPGDMGAFRSITRGSTVIMGRVTYESLGGKGLPGRQIIIVTSSSDVGDMVVTAPSLVEALKLCVSPGQKVFVAGGWRLYAEALMHPDLGSVYISRINVDPPCDTFFVGYDPTEFIRVEFESHKGFTLERTIRRLK